MNPITWSLLGQRLINSHTLELLRTFENPITISRNTDNNFTHISNSKMFPSIKKVTQISMPGF